MIFPLTVIAILFVLSWDSNTEELRKSTSTRELQIKTSALEKTLRVHFIIWCLDSCQESTLLCMGILSSWCCQSHPPNNKEACSYINLFYSNSEFTFIYKYVSRRISSRTEHMISFSLERTLWAGHPQFHELSCSGIETKFTEASFPVITKDTQRRCFPDLLSPRHPCDPCEILLMVMVHTGGRESAHSLSVQLIPLPLARWPIQAHTEHMQTHTCTQTALSQQDAHTPTRKTSFRSPLWSPPFLHF